MSGSQVGPPPSPQLFFETANAFHKTEALRTAVELGLFTVIAEGKQGVDDIAAACKASVRGTRILCDFLVVNSFLTKDANRYALTRDSAVFLEAFSRVSRRRAAIFESAQDDGDIQAPHRDRPAGAKL
jgi:hypothetical protein